MLLGARLGRQIVVRGAVQRFSRRARRNVCVELLEGRQSSQLGDFQPGYRPVQPVDAFRSFLGYVFIDATDVVPAGGVELEQYRLRLGGIILPFFRDLLKLASEFTSSIVPEMLSRLLLMSDRLRCLVFRAWRIFWIMSSA